MSDKVELQFVDELRGELKPVFDIKHGFTAEPVSFNLILKLTPTCTLEISEFMARNITKLYEALLEKEINPHKRNRDFVMPKCREF